MKYIVIIIVGILMWNFGYWQNIDIEADEGADVWDENIDVEWEDHEIELEKEWDSVELEWEEANWSSQDEETDIQIETEWEARVWDWNIDVEWTWSEISKTASATDVEIAGIPRGAFYILAGVVWIVWIYFVLKRTGYIKEQK